MNRRVTFFGLASVVTLLGSVAVAACSSTTTTVDPGTGTGDSGPETTPPREASTLDDSATSEDTSVAPTGDQACGAMATKQDCGTCCVTNHKTGYTTFQNVLLACTCMGTGADAATGPCATDCADTACKSPPANPNAACTTCLQTSIGTGGTCVDTVSSTCMADADCLAEQKCIALCTSKP